MLKSCYFYALPVQPHFLRCDRGETDLNQHHGPQIVLEYHSNYEIPQVYIFFLIAVSIRYGFVVYRAIRYGLEEPIYESLEDRAK